jgi:hypothetical protein
MPENDYDKANRYAANLDAPGFLSWLLGLPPERFAFRGWLNTRRLPALGWPWRNEAFRSAGQPMSR